ncbi:hypothetical protein ALP75_203794 [Pseudomonas syringae pv. actinidiae]|nr:hypothetical protein ALP75_203794 [Pseudomonas syringae pv. actinidiae]
MRHTAGQLANGFKFLRLMQGVARKPQRFVGLFFGLNIATNGMNKLLVRYCCPGNGPV